MFGSVHRCHTKRGNEIYQIHRLYVPCQDDDVENISDKAKQADSNAKPAVNDHVNTSKLCKIISIIGIVTRSYVVRLVRRKWIRKDRRVRIA